MQYGLAVEVCFAFNSASGRRGFSAFPGAAPVMALIVESASLCITYS
jgi:hypothetical protein